MDNLQYGINNMYKCKGTFSLRDPVTRFRDNIFNKMDKKFQNYVQNRFDTETYRGNSKISINNQKDPETFFKLNMKYSGNDSIQFVNDFHNLSNDLKELSFLDISDKFGLLNYLQKKKTMEEFLSKYNNENDILGNLFKTYEYDFSSRPFKEVLEK